MTAAPIRYYCPAGGSVPAYAATLPPHGCVAGRGPDVDAQLGEGGGVVYGGAFRPNEPGWQRTAAGWWVNLGGVRPQDLVKLDTDPRIVRWVLVDGDRREHRWKVPVLLRPEFTDEGETDVYVSALERVWRGGDKWDDPAHLVELQRRLRAVAIGLALADGESLTENRALVQVVVDLLACGQDISEHELVAGGWLTERMLVRVTIAAAAVPLPPEDG